MLRSGGLQCWFNDESGGERVRGVQSRVKISLLGAFFQDMMVWVIRCVLLEAQRTRVRSR